MKIFKALLMILVILQLTNSVASSQVSATLPEGITSHFAKVNGIQLHYLEAGKGSLIIVLHGWPETSFAWHLNMNALSKNYRIVAPDLRGLGLSERTKSGYDKKTIATDIKSLIEYLGEKQAVIIGHDLGGKIAYFMAHLYPQMISKLILSECFIPGTENTDPLHGGAWYYGFHMTPDIPEMLTSGHEREYIRAQIKAWSYKKDAISESTIDEYVKHYATKGGMTAGFNYYRTFKEDIAFAKSFQNQKLSIPILTIIGRHGRVGDKLPNALKNEALNLTSITFEDSGHFVAEEDPELFNSSVLKFLDNKNKEKI